MLSLYTLQNLLKVLFSLTIFSLIYFIIILNFRSKTKSRSPKRRKRSPTPRPTKVHIGKLTKNVNKDHIMEIFSTYGTIKNIDIPSERVHPEFSRGHCYIDFDKPEEAEAAVKFMDGGK